MSLPIMSGTGRLTDDPELRYTPTGLATCTVRLAFNQRKKTEDGEWEDGDAFYVNGIIWREMAEQVAESLTKGTEVVVTGRLKTRSYTTKNDEKRSVVELLVDSIGPNLRYVNARVQKLTRRSDNGGGSTDSPPLTADDTRMASVGSTPSDFKAPF